MTEHIHFCCPFCNRIITKLPNPNFVWCIVQEFSGRGKITTKSRIHAKEIKNTAYGQHIVRTILTWIKELVNLGILSKLDFLLYQVETFISKFPASNLVKCEYSSIAEPPITKTYEVVSWKDFLKQAEPPISKSFEEVKL